MSKPSSIQIGISNPCHQRWDEMTPDERGRFCDRCRKTVLDFTTWTDTALYNYFSQDNGVVCGRLLPSQLDREIHIPYQPHSRLYRITIALGLTLMMAQTPQVLARSGLLVETQSILDTSRISSPQNEDGAFGEIKGTVIDEKKEPLIVAVVRLYKDNILKDSVVTDIYGNYSFKDLSSGRYDLVTTYVGYITSNWQNIVVVPSKVIQVNVTLEPSESRAMTGLIVCPVPKLKKPLIDRDNPTKMTYDREDLSRMR